MNVNEEEKRAYARAMIKGMCNWNPFASDPDRGKHTHLSPRFCQCPKCVDLRRIAQGESA